MLQVAELVVSGCSCLNKISVVEYFEQAYDFDRDMTNEILNINVIFENMTHRSLPSCYRGKGSFEFGLEYYYCYAKTVNNTGTKSASSR